MMQTLSMDLQTLYNPYLKYKRTQLDFNYYFVVEHSIADNHTDTSIVCRRTTFCFVIYFV